jgi:hypothetical protein
MPSWSPAPSTKLVCQKTRRGASKTPKVFKDAPVLRLRLAALLFDESQAHLSAVLHRTANFDELENVTARVSHPRPSRRIRRAQGPRRPRFSFFRFNCQTARPPKAAASNSIAAKRPDTETARCRNVKTPTGPKTRKTVPDPAKPSQMRRTPRNPEKQNPRPPQKQRRSQWRPYMAPLTNMSTRKNGFGVSSRFRK